MTKEFGEFMLLARKLVPAMLRGGQWFDEIGDAHSFEITDAAGKLNDGIESAPLVVRAAALALIANLPPKRGMWPGLSCLRKMRFAASYW
ncbi:MAG: hypothetical protein ABSH38_20090 [Verrucomicrobiota bacterium]